MAWSGRDGRPLLCHLRCIEAGELDVWLSRFSSSFSPSPSPGRCDIDIHYHMDSRTVPYARTMILTPASSIWS
jgi:hypothetical protein